MNTNRNLTACNLHLVKGCKTCFKARTACDFGACSRRATKVVVSPAERRGSCDKHVKDVSRNYPAATVEAAA